VRRKAIGVRLWVKDESLKDEKEPPSLTVLVIMGIGWGGLLIGLLVWLIVVFPIYFHL